MNENGNASSFQRVAIAIGTVIIVVLTVVAALFLAMQDLPDSEEPPAVVEISPTPTTPSVIVTFTPAPTATPLPTQTPSATPTSLPPLPTNTPLPPPTATFTNTPLPPPPTPTPTFTLTPMVVVVSPTPLPVPPTTEPPLPTGGVCQPPPTWVAYLVQPGDTLDTLAARTDTSVFELQQVNCLNSFTLKVGQTIYLPFTPPTPTVTYTPSPTGTRGPTPTRTPTAIAPQIESVTPNRVDRETADTEVIITVLGRNFKPDRLGFKIELRGPASIELELGDTFSSTSFDAIVPPGLPEGTYSLVVTNPDGRAGIRQSAYTIGPPGPTDTPSPPPDITRFTPTSGNANEEITLTVQGVNFKPNQPGFKVELQSTGSSLRVELDLGEIRTDTNFTAIIRANTLERGDYNLVVTNPDGRSDIAPTIYRAL
jgi:LysM repeat protein